jgi:hypothetical protein
MSTVPGGSKSTGGNNDETLALPPGVKLDSALAQTVAGTKAQPSVSANSDRLAKSLASLPNYEIQN